MQRNSWNQFIKRTAFSAAMNHGVAIRANNGQIIEFCLAGFGSVSERFEMMHLRVIPAKFAINCFKIKTTFWHGTY